MFEARTKVYALEYSLGVEQKFCKLYFKSVIAHLSIVLKVSYWDQSMSVVHRVCRQQLEITTPQYTTGLIFTGILPLQK